MNEYTVEDVFHIKHKGYVLHTEIPKNVPLDVFYKVQFADDEEYRITGIERSMLLLSTPIPSTNVNILIGGELKYDKKDYIGKKFKIYT